MYLETGLPKLEKTRTKPHQIRFGKHAEHISGHITPQTEGVDYIVAQQRFRSKIKMRRTKTFHRANTGSDHDLLMLSFHTHLPKVKRPQFTWLKFDLEKLKNPDIVETFQVATGGKIAQLFIYNDDGDIDGVITII